MYFKASDKEIKARMVVDRSISPPQVGPQRLPNDPRQSPCARVKPAPHPLPRRGSPRIDTHSMPGLCFPGRPLSAAHSPVASDQPGKWQRGHQHNKGGPKQHLRSCKTCRVPPWGRSGARELEVAGDTLSPLRPIPQLRSAFICNVNVLKLPSWPSFLSLKAD